MTSKVSTMSYRFSASGAASGVTPSSPLLPESRASTRGAESFPSGMDFAKSRPIHHLPQVFEGDGATEEEKQNLDSDEARKKCTTKRSTVMKDLTLSTDSEASVYTQNSSRLSDTHQPLRPAPLNLTQQPIAMATHFPGSGPLSSAVGSGFMYPDSSIVSQLQVRQGTVDDRYASPSPLPMVPVAYRPPLLYNRNNFFLKRYFCYPLNQKLPFHSRNKTVRGISDLIKTSLTNYMRPLWHRPKKAIQGPNLI